MGGGREGEEGAVAVAVMPEEAWLFQKKKLAIGCLAIARLIF